MALSNRIMELSMKPLMGLELQMADLQMGLKIKEYTEQWHKWQCQTHSLCLVIKKSLTGLNITHKLSWPTLRLRWSSTWKRALGSSSTIFRKIQHNQTVNYIALQGLHKAVYNSRQFDCKFSANINLFFGGNYFLASAVFVYPAFVWQVDEDPCKESLEQR